jgi:hypothetical protein
MPLRTSLSDLALMADETEEGVKEESIVRRQAAKPATWGAAIDVPEADLVLPSFHVEIMSDPEEITQIVNLGIGVPILHAPGAQISRTTP